ncbi:LAQU0S01e04038g1_1 [Lachancea quebecensis]|uniref:LAQU0S01e04038g1_1 n=1 Tax=Lachancea quebecensis TaxID=1654605 RepID=A0A0P1KUW2_9SACH|nr:LAQU0S01e04038g1_1 [Lachancea quebecensis]
MPEENGDSLFAFYAFYQLYTHLFCGGKKDLSFDTLQNRLYPRLTSSPTKAAERTSLFITWKKKSASRGEYLLRGCIGTFAKLPLLEGIEKYSIIAALQDPRFSPITRSELPSLKCSCNILHSFSTIYEADASTGDIFDWEVGVHGIELRLQENSRKRVLSATFLPEVIREQGWDKHETFRNLIRKAGFLGDIDAALDNWQECFVEVIRYEGDKTELNYDEFIRLLDIATTNQ